MSYKTVNVPLSDQEEEALRIAASKACRRPRDQVRYILLQALGLNENEVSAQPASNRANLARTPDPA